MSNCIKEDNGTPLDSISIEPVLCENTSMQQKNKDSSNKEDGQVDGNALQNFAVHVRNGNLAYRLWKNELTPLKNVNIGVPEGVIYGLLGPSGSGKTTLLKTMVGLVRLLSGEVKVLGKPLDRLNKGSIGFMSQELTLYNELTIRENLIFFGKLQNIDFKTINSRIELYTKILDLTSMNKVVRQLSWSEQRRVSLIVALIHHPAVLLLDEPTMAMDATIRRKIWSLLTRLSIQERLTIIVSANQIEEVQQAHIIGLMSKGYILLESSPPDIFRYCEEHSLEDSLLEACKLHQSNRNSNLQTTQNNSDLVVSIPIEGKPIVENNTDILIENAALKYKVEYNRKECVQSLDWFCKIGILIWKNICCLKTKPFRVLFECSISAMLVLGMFFCLNTSFKGMSLAVVNLEDPDLWGKRYLDAIDPKVIIQVPHNSVASALESVKKGNVLGTLYIGPDFTDALSMRTHEGLYVSAATLNRSTIRVYMDMSNQQVAYYIQKVLLESLQKFSVDLLKVLGGNPGLNNLLIVFDKPIYGSMQMDLIAMLTPGILINITFFVAAILTASSSIKDRKNGVLVRIWLSGATPFQVVLSHLLTKLFIMMIQITGVLVIVLFIATIEGSYLLVCAIFFLQGICGMCFGLFVSSISPNESIAMIITAISLETSMLISGTSLPREGQSPFVRRFSQILPQTFPIEALRAIFIKASGIEFFTVWMAITVTLSWTVVSFLVTVMMYKIRK